MIDRRIIRAAALGTLALHVACGSSPTQHPTPTPTAAPTAMPTDVPPVDCPHGNLYATCLVDAPMKFHPDITRAVDQLVKDRPEIFNLQESLGAGQYRILDRKEYRNGLIRNLNAVGFCAEAPDGSTIQLKRDNDHSERYSVATAAGFVRRDLAAHLYTCNPAGFPLTETKAIDSVFTNFYTFECAPGITPPRNMAGVLPMGCVGYMTATPKDELNQNVPPSVTGMAVRWQMISADGAPHAVLTVDPSQPYNVMIEPTKPGDWDACATVRGVRGCRHVATIP